jgi:hypothetical protein
VPKPAFRVVVGYKNKVQIMACKLLPDSWWRALVRRVVGLRAQ